MKNQFHYTRGFKPISKNTFHKMHVFFGGGKVETRDLGDEPDVHLCDATRFKIVYLLLRFPGLNSNLGPSNLST